MSGPARPAAPGGDLVVEEGEGLRTLVLHAPARANALDRGLVAALHREVDRAGRDGVAVLALRGAGRHFCAGFHLGGLDGETDSTFSDRFLAVGRLLAAVASSPCLTVAVAQGAAVGAGADLVNACAVRVGVGAATLRFPGARFGLVLGTRLLAQRIGPARAVQVLGRGEAISARRALAWGLLTDHVGDGDEADALVRSLARDARALHPVAADLVLAACRATGPEEDLALLRASLSRGSIHRRVSEHAARPRRPPRPARPT